VGLDGTAELKKMADHRSKTIGALCTGNEVRVDKVKEVQGQGLRVHICEVRDSEQCSTGWMSSMLLACQSKGCSRCHDCGANAVLPSDNYQKLIDFEMRVKSKLIEDQLRTKEAVDAAGPSKAVARAAEDAGHKCEKGEVHHRAYLHYGEDAGVDIVMGPHEW